MTKTILDPTTAHRIGADPILGAAASTKVGFRNFISFIELAPVFGQDDTFVWVSRDESGDTVDFISAEDAAAEIANGYESGE